MKKTYQFEGNLLLGFLFSFIALLLIAFGTAVYFENYIVPEPNSALSILIVAIISFLTFAVKEFYSYSSHLEIKDGRLYHIRGRTKAVWSVNILEIIAIDDKQGHIRPSEPELLNILKMGSKSKDTIAFTIKTRNSQCVVENNLKDYQNFLKDLLQVNPSISVIKVSESIVKDYHKRDYGELLRERYGHIPIFSGFINWLSQQNVVVVAIIIIIITGIIFVGALILITIF